jgi:mono/diheme cytochrome c family protein
LALAAVAVTATLGTASIASTDQQARPPGEAQYVRLCQTCHGSEGRGDGPSGRALEPSPRDFTSARFRFDANGNGVVGEDEDLFLVIRNGAAAYGGSPMMLRRDRLSERELLDLVRYIRSFAR